MNDSNPAQAEAEGVTMVTVTWRDLDPFEVPLFRSDWSFDAALASEQEQEATLAAELLPAAQLEQFRRMRPSMADTRDLLNAIGDAIGLAVGESQASSS